MIEYNKRLVEVNTILSYLSQDNYEKIPKEVIQAIKDNMDKEYTWEYDETKELKEQELNRNTIAILSYINMEYLLNEKQKEYMKNIHETNEKNQRQREYSNENKYDYSELFNRNEKIEDNLEKTEKKQETSLIEYKENFLKKIINKIKRFFTK